MEEQRKAIFKILQSDKKLNDMLPKNYAFWNPTLCDTGYSILPSSKISKSLNRPFVTIQLSSETLIEKHLNNTFIYIRCYNELDKTYVEIDNILSRIKEILHSKVQQQFSDKKVSIDMVYENTSADAIDQAYNLNFRESAYKLSYV